MNDKLIYNFFNNIKQIYNNIDLNEKHYFLLLIGTSNT